jgi:hypothetical protein
VRSCDACGGVEDLLAGILREADEETAAGLRGAQRLHPLLDGGAEAAVEQQVFGRISRERELRQHEQIRFELAAGALRGADDHRRVARDVADEHVQLPEGDAQAIVGRVHRCSDTGITSRAAFSPIFSSSRSA